MLQGGRTRASYSSLMLVIFSELFLMVSESRAFSSWHCIQHSNSQMLHGKRDLV